MTTEDRDRWNGRYQAVSDSASPSVPTGFAAVVDLLPTEGRALDVACGVGEGAVWLALRGLDVDGFDGSDVAIDRATELARAHGVAEQCRFSTWDLDEGLPDGPKVDLITCHLFSARSLDRLMIERLSPNGVLAITVLSEVGGEAGPFRAAEGELIERFAALDIRHHRERAGTATLVGFAAGPLRHGRLD